MAKLDFLTPVGRLVTGDCWEPFTEDINGNPLTIKQGPKMGQVTQEYNMTLAFRKDDPELPAFLAKMYGYARSVWPQHFQGPPGWPDNGPSCTHPQFSMKWQDGDGVDGNGKPNNTKEGYAGCIILKTSSTFPPKIFYKDHYSPSEEIKDKMLARRGDWFRVGGQMDTNNFPTKPGIKFYCGQAALWFKDKEIISGPSASQIFGAAAAGVAPAGAQALPVLGAPQPMAIAGAAPLAMPGVAMPMAAPAAISMPGTTFAPPAGMSVPGGITAPVQYVTPNPAMLAGPTAVPGLPAMGQPQPLMMQQPQPLQMAPAEPQITAKAQQMGHTYATMRAAGYDDATLRANGFIV